MPSNNHTNFDRLSLTRLAVPKGRIEPGVTSLLAAAGIELRSGPRGYRPVPSVPGYEVKLLKPQTIVEMLAAGSRDAGFAGADWVAEKDADLVELLDTGLDPVSMVVAAPESLLESGALPRRPLVVASEYERLTRRWIEQRGLTASFVRSYGATEVFPPGDADCIVDNTATGATLVANGLEIVDVLMTSSTRLYANPRVMEDVGKRSVIEDLVLLLRSVLEARSRVMVEVNVPADRLDDLIAFMPFMPEPTASPLNTGQGYAVKAAVTREVLDHAIPEVMAGGGSDSVATEISQMVPGGVDRA